MPERNPADDGGRVENSKRNLDARSVERRGPCPTI
jgi:hypothetical protein